MLVETAVMLALATALSYVKIFELPMGGSITLFSLVPIVIIGYRYGLKQGFSAGIIYGVLQLLLQGLGYFSYVKGIVAYIVLILADYVLAFMSLSVGGAMFRKMKNQTVALGVGAAIGCLMRFICHFVSGVTIWADYAGGWQAVWKYSLAYNGSFMGVEAIVTIIGVVALSFVFDFKSESLRRVKKAD